MDYKRRRSTLLSSFTRNANTLEEMISGKSPLLVVNPQLAKVQSYWDKLEEAHDTFMESYEGEISETDENYLVAPDNRYKALVQKYTEYFKAESEAEKETAMTREMSLREAEVKLSVESKLKSAKIEFELSLNGFKNLVDRFESLGITEKQFERDQVEIDYRELKKQFIKLAAIDENADLSELEKSYLDTEKSYLAIRKDTVANLYP